MPRLNELNVRPESGSDALPFVRWRGSKQDYDSRRLIIFVHGFNTSELGAFDSYRKFLSLLSRGPLGPRLASNVTSSFWAFYWPGDHTNGLVKVVKALDVYNSRKLSAEHSGQALGKLIMRLDPEREIVLVAHSMGCRVVLEALHYVAELRNDYHVQGGAQVSAACLMAAAVPVGICEGVAARYPWQPGEPAELVLYSEYDGVLGGDEVLGGLGKLVSGFEVAEWLYDSREGPAVGATGQPKGRWLDRSGNTNLPVSTGLGHTKYWDSDESAQPVGRLLSGLPPRGVLAAAGRVGPAGRARKQSRRQQQARATASRQIGDVRSLPWQNC